MGAGALPEKGLHGMERVELTDNPPNDCSEDMGPSAICARQSGVVGTPDMLAPRVSSSARENFASAGAGPSRLTLWPLSRPFSGAAGHNQIYPESHTRRAGLVEFPTTRRRLRALRVAEAGNSLPWPREASAGVSRHRRYRVASTCRSDLRNRPPVKVVANRAECDPCGPDLRNRCGGNSSAVVGVRMCDGECSRC
jgi:hypothetical protein